MAIFKKLFPSEEQVLAYFAPAKWNAALQHVEKCTFCPSATLRVLEQFYMTGTAEAIVCNNIIGIYSIARPSEAINREAITRTAELFVGKFGTDLTPFGLLYYFANYLMEYKSTYSQFDLQDLLRQCGKVYMPWWLKRQSLVTPPKDELEYREEGITALYSYLRREYVGQGRDPRESPLYRLGKINDEQLQIVLSSEEPAF